MAGSFYITDGERFLSTEYTRGPWDPRYQHAGPPAALMARAIEHLDGGEDFSVSRFTVEVLHSIRVGPLTVQARFVRPGKRVQLAEAVLSDENGEVALARAWLAPGHRGVHDPWLIGHVDAHAGRPGGW